ALRRMPVAPRADRVGALFLGVVLVSLVSLLAARMFESPREPQGSVQALEIGARFVAWTFAGIWLGRARHAGGELGLGTPLALGAAIPSFVAALGHLLLLVQVLAPELFFDQRADPSEKALRLAESVTLLMNLHAALAAIASAGSIVL